MAIRTDFNPFGLTINVVATDFVAKPGRGRPQTNPYVTIDLSGVSELCSNPEIGEKRIRNEAFKLLRNHLGINPKTLIIESPKGDGRWIVKDDSCRNDFTVTVGSITPDADNIFG
jgi:hypothetical protein